MGAVVAHLAEKDMESARVVMRRLMCSLNDESGGIGWGAPEAMGEIIASHEGLASELTMPPRCIQPRLSLRDSVTSMARTSSKGSPSLPWARLRLRRREAMG